MSTTTAIPDSALATEAAHSSIVRAFRLETDHNKALILHCLAAQQRLIVEALEKLAAQAEVPA